MEYEYISTNGYKGRIYGEKEFSIYDSKGNRVLHTSFRNIDSYEELKDSVDSFPELIKILKKQEEFDG